MSKGSVLIADDVNEKSFPGVVKAWDAIKKKGLVRELECVKYPQPILGWYKGWCAGKVL